MITCEVCKKLIEEDKAIDIRVGEDSVGYVVFHVHERCVVGMGVTARRLLEELRNQ